MRGHKRIKTPEMLMENDLTLAQPQGRHPYRTTSLYPYYFQFVSPPEGIAFEACA